MCLPIKCLKTVVIFFAVLTILASVASIVVGIIAMTKDASSFWKNTDWTTYVYGPAFLIVLGFLILILGIFGVVGAAKKNGCCITIYNLGNIPLSAGFIILGIAVAIVLSKQKSALQQFIDDPILCAKAGTKNKDYKWIQDTNTYFNKALGKFGDTTQDAILLTDKSGPFFDYMHTPALNLQFSDTGKKNVISYITPQGAEIGYQALLQFQEETLKCAGMCSIQQYFIFTDVNKGFTKGKNQNTCIFYLKQFFDNFGQTVLITTFIVGGLLLINSMLAFCLCCHPDKKKKGGNFYQRMSYTEED